jgi:2-polyprenyl-3-methyl-5-hydroxy-6-metoxy-1,4-benzoquinol methylase
MDLRELPSHAFQRHPWEKARADFFLRVLRDHVTDGQLSVVDFGSGDGFFAERLVETWPAVSRVVCFDPAYAPERAPPKNEGKIAFTRSRPEGRCDVLVLLDVLEHTANDQAMLHDALSTCLGPGGWLLLSVPAHPMLFSHHDELLGHKRRYSPAALLALARNEDVTVVEQGQLFACLLLPRALAKLSETLRPRTIHAAAADAMHVETSLTKWNRGAITTRAVEAVLSWDAAIARKLARQRLPVPGLSTWLLARKK